MVLGAQCAFCSSPSRVYMTRWKSGPVPSSCGSSWSMTSKPMRLSPVMRSGMVLLRWSCGGVRQGAWCLGNLGPSGVCFYELAGAVLGDDESAATLGGAEGYGYEGVVVVLDELDSFRLGDARDGFSRCCPVACSLIALERRLPASFRVRCGDSGRWSRGPGRLV